MITQLPLERFEKRTEWPLAIAAVIFLAAYSVGRFWPRVALPSFLGELVERRPRRDSVDRGVDRFHISFDLVPILAGGEPKRVAQQVNDASLHDRLRPHAMANSSVSGMLGNIRCLAEASATIRCASGFARSSSSR